MTAPPQAQAVPKPAVPEQATPKQATPKQAVPEQAVPKQATPKQAVAEQAVPDQARPEVAETSLGKLLGDVSRDLSSLISQELQLAAAELKEEASKAGRGAGLVAGAGFAGYMVLLFASIAVWRGLATVIPDEWAALVVAVVWAVVGMALAVKGRAALHKVHPKPERTVDTLKRVPGALRGQ